MTFAHSSPTWRPISMSLTIGLLALLLLCLPAQGLAGDAKLKRINPDGIPGTLILCGTGEVPDEAINQFFKLGQGNDGSFRFVHVGEAKLPLDKIEVYPRLSKEAYHRKIKKYGLAGGRSVKKTKPEILRKSLAKTTGIWLLGSDPVEINILVDRAQVADVLKRGGVFAASGEVAELFASPRTKVANDVRRTIFGFGWLPDALISISAKTGKRQFRMAKMLARHPGFVGYKIAPETALIVRGRRLFAVGKGEVTIHLPASVQRPARTITLHAGKREVADLTALRRAARQRSGEPFPPKEPRPPVVKKGTLVIVGGGRMPRRLTKKFVELAGGRRAQIVVLPTAAPDPIPKRQSIAEAFRKAGAGKVTVLPQRKLEDVESKEFLDTLKNATGIWFGGGRQWRFVDAYENTKVHKLMHDVLRHGGVIGGSSAGASIQAEYLARGNPLGNVDIMAEGYERGLGFLKGVAIDQHFSQRKRFADMRALVKRYPQLLGIGIDESTAIIVQGSVAEVVGRGRVHFYDARRKVERGQPHIDAVSAGSLYDLKARKVLDAGRARK